MRFGGYVLCGGWGVVGGFVLGSVILILESREEGGG